MSFYSKHRWRRVSELYRSRNPLCEVSASMGYTVAANVTDHIIRIEDGGAQWDERNYMPMSHKAHNIKRAFESRGLSLKAIQTETGLIPEDRNEIIEILTKRLKRKKINIDGSRG